MCVESLNCVCGIPETCVESLKFASVDLRSDRQVACMALISDVSVTPLKSAWNSFNVCGIPYIYIFVESLNCVWYPLNVCESPPI